MVRVCLSRNSHETFWEELTNNLCRNKNLSKSNKEAAEMTNHLICLEKQSQSLSAPSLTSARFTLLLVFAHTGDNAISSQDKFSEMDLPSDSQLSYQQLFFSRQPPLHFPLCLPVCPAAASSLLLFAPTPQLCQRSHDRKIPQHPQTICRQCG